MELINITQVAALFEVSENRIERMTKESLLHIIEEQSGVPMYDKSAIERYKTFADRLGGI